jgi:hypothetical protein
MDPDPDPGGPKTCGSGGSGSGSPTLLSTIFFLLFDRLLKKSVPVLESMFLIDLIWNIEHFMGYQTAIRIFPVEP